MLLIAVLLVVFPVKIAAGWVQAGRTGFGSCLIAVILATAFQAVVQSLFGGESVTALLGSLLATPVAYMLVLDTTFVKGLIIAVVQTLLLLLAILILAGLGLGLQMG